MNPDRCPGVLRPHQAADGTMVRIRVPGGRTDAAALRRLGALAGQYGSGLLQLTSRGGLQLRGLPDEPPAAFADALAEAGFLPSASHERVRNVVASPLTGLDGGRADLRPLVGALDAALTADDTLAGLSGRFLFGLDDGRGDLAALRPDLTYRALDADRGLVLVGAEHAVATRQDEAVAMLADLARRFVAAAAPTGAWRVAALPGFASGLGLDAAPDLPDGLPPRLGAVGPHASVAVPLGLLSPAQLAAVTAVDGPVVVTPWRGLVLPDAAHRLPALVEARLVTEDSSPWTALSACVGAPWCGHGRVDTRALLLDAVRTGAAWPRTHVSGCEHRCGAPATAHVDLVAPSRDALLAVASGAAVARA